MPYLCLLHDTEEWNVIFGQSPTGGMRGAKRLAKQQIMACLVVDQESGSVKEEKHETTILKSSVTLGLEV